MDHIRNFCIIAHIDHGKSTLADRLLERTKTIQVTEGQMLDNMDLERERGITIKSHAIQMEYTMEGKKYLLNLIDTPGHVDFSYEVSRSIAACEGALLIVDATQGVQAQTISNLYMAIDHDLEIIPVINKIDMPNAMPEEVEDEIVDLLGCEPGEIIRASGKTGEGVDDILRAVVDRIPAPTGDKEAPLQALIFDSVFNSFRGIITLVKIDNGVVRKGDKVKFFNTGQEYDADEVGVLKMDMVPKAQLSAGEVGYIISGIKDAKEVKVGDTVKNWNGLGVQLSSVFHLTQDPARPGYEYLGVRVTVLNRSKTETYTIGAQGVDAINAAYPVPPLENVDANFQAMAAATTDFVATCDGQGAAVSANISLYNSNSQSFSDSETLPPQGSGYIVLMLQVPTGWKELQVTYMPTFAPDKTLTFTMKAADVIRG